MTNQYQEWHYRRLDCLHEQSVEVPHDKSCYAKRLVPQPLSLTLLALLCSFGSLERICRLQSSIFTDMDCRHDSDGDSERELAVPKQL